MAADALQLLGANALFLLAGLGLLRLAGWTTTSRVGRSALAFVAGVASVGVLAPLLLLAGASLTVLQVVAVCLALFAAGFLRRPPAPSPADGSGRGLVLPAAVLLAALGLLLAVDLWFQPLAIWDAWQHWTAKARSIVLLDGLDADLFGDPRYLIWNTDYPLLLPAVEAIDFRFMGLNTRILHLQFGLLLGGFALALGEAAGRRVPQVVVWPVLVATLWAPGLLIQTASAYADVPLAIFVALLGVCTWRWLADGEAPVLALAALLAAAALATKMEAQVFVLAVLSAAGALLLASERRRLLPLAGAALGAFLVGIVPWRIWTLVHDAHGVYSSEEFLSRATSPATLADTGARVPLAALELGWEALDPRSWLLAVPLALAAGVVAFRAGRRQVALFALGAVGLTFVGLVALYWATPLPFEWHLDRSASRVVASPVLLAAALTPVLVAEALRPAR